MSLGGFAEAEGAQCSHAAMMQTSYYVVLVYPSCRSVRLNSMASRQQAAQHAATWYHTRTDTAGDLPISVTIGVNGGDD